MIFLQMQQKVYMYIYVSVFPRQVTSDNSSFCSARLTGNDVTTPPQTCQIFLGAINPNGKKYTK
jgi:hypothetical protein